ncbi:hypothetical protein CBR_g36401 [Chara braunii]|uniref:Right handed beta helix domain-containing protein n=1 Tax=Chara braunii TaxID=69332 RepID=A0A388LKW7_CHABU|nr:hypothetical protein CBR_g36401 [Chara braunii]|eukprot:GBG82875.1 hypothetical protein CBR_g36401 [Chara braunii]
MQWTMTKTKKKTATRTMAMAMAMAMVMLTVTGMQAAGMMPGVTAPTTHSDLVNAVTSKCSIVLTSDVVLTSNLSDVNTTACPELKIVGNCSSRRNLKCKIDGAGRYSFLRCPRTVHLENLHITRMASRGTDSAPVVLRPVTLVMKKCLVTRNANRDGTGAIILWEGDGTLQDSIFDGNSGSNGGALLLDSFSQLAAVDVLFRRNTGVAGGAIKNVESELQCDRCLFLRNQAEDGGAVYLTDSDGTHATFTRTEFRSNRAARRGGRGGAVFIEEVDPGVRFCFCTFAKNTVAMAYGRRVAEHVYVRMDLDLDANVTFCPDRPQTGITICPGSESKVKDDCTGC